MTVESLMWYPEHQSQSCGMPVGPQLHESERDVCPVENMPVPRLYLWTGPHTRIILMH